MGTIQKMQLRVVQLQAALQSGTLPPGPNYAGGHFMNPEQKEHAQKEVQDLKTRQLALVGNVKTFVDMNGGQQRVAQEIRAFKTAQGGGGPRLALTSPRMQLKPEDFAASLKRVMAKRGVLIEDSYYIEGVKVPLYALFQAVMVTGGGGEKVDSDRSWVLIAQEIELPDSTSFANALAKLFNIILRPYEDVWSTAILKQRDKMALENAQKSSDSASDSGYGSVGIPINLLLDNIW
ncbi:hypothetical protein RQP46_005664 [Phenoliferia psychrophenolica]